MTLVERGENVEFSFMPGLPLNVSRDARVAPIGDPVGLADNFDCDVLILQRPMAGWQLLGLRDAQKRGIRVVVELDDDIANVDPRSAFGMQVRPEHRRTLGACCREADLVTVSTQALADRYAPHGRAAVLPNYVPGWWVDIDSAPERAVGWTGSIGSHVSDLQAACGGIGMALADHGGVFRCWGSGNEKSHDLIGRAVGADPQIGEWQDRDQYPRALAKLMVGVAPLTDSVFNASKSWLKPLELAACGVPCVMSPTAEYRRLHNTFGIGALAGWRSREWRRETGRMLSDEPYRLELAERGRETVRESLTVEDNAWRFAEAWQSTLAVV
jgi:hypothetical protein